MPKSKNLHCVGTIVANDMEDSAYSGACWVIDTPVGSNISPDADGAMGSTQYILVDLSYMLSEKLGRQMPMTATYRVKGIQIGLRNVDDTDDNDRGAFFAGTMFWHSPTKHKIDALQAARFVERHNELDQVDGDSIFFGSTAQNDYSGFRFNWNEDNQIAHPTGEAIGAIAGNSRDEWNIQDTLVGYSYGALAHGSEERTNQLWGRRTGVSDEMQWSAQILNALHEDSVVTSTALLEKPERNDFVAPIPANNHLELLGGLLLISVAQSNSIPNGDVSPDDYDIQVSLQVEGWEKW